MLLRAFVYEFLVMLVNGRLGVDWFRSMIYWPNASFYAIQTGKFSQMLSHNASKCKAWKFLSGWYKLLPQSLDPFLLQQYRIVFGINLTHYVNEIPFVSKSASFTFKQTTISVLGAPFFKKNPFEVNWNSDHYVTSVVAYHNVCTYSFSKAFITCFLSYFIYCENTVTFII